MIGEDLDLARKRQEEVRAKANLMPCELSRLENPKLPLYTLNNYECRRLKIGTQGVNGLATLVVGLTAYADNLPKVGQNCNVLMTGDTGLGKTHLSQAVAIRARERHNDGKRTFRFVSWYHQLETIKEAWDNEKLDETGLWNDMLHSWLLVLDGFDICNKWSAWLVSCMYRVLDYRIQWALPTVITMNCTLDELRAMMLTGRDVRDEIADALITRLKQRNGIQVHLSGTRWADLTPDERVGNAEPKAAPYNPNTRKTKP
jgi:hypothetical protein